MNTSTALAIAALAVTMIIGFAKTMMMLGQIELKLNLMWEAYVRGRADFLVGGRRHDDPQTTDHHR